MSRQDNMLEAFRDATKRASETETAGGPFAGAPTEPLASGRDATADPRRWLIAFAALGLVFVLGLWIGRTTGGGTIEDEARASAPDERSGWVPPGEEAASRARAQRPATAELEAGAGDPDAAVAALYDRANKYTVVAISVTRSNEDLAWSNHDHLRASGLPAFLPFEAPNGMLVIVVGAAPKESDLKDVRSRLQRLSGPDGRGQPYSGAYFSPIAPLLGRSDD